MMLNNNIIFDLDYRSYFLRGNHNFRFLTASKEGHITIIDLANKAKITLNLNYSISDITFSDARNLISVIDDSTKNLVILDLSGKTLYTENPVNETQEFISCYFDENEKYLWYIAALKNSKIEIQLRLVDTFSIISRFIIEDPFGDSHFAFYSTNKPNRLALWIAAGQDGQQIYWMENVNETIFLQEELALADMTPPFFSPSGNEFLILDDYEKIIYKYQYPNIKVGKCEWQPDDENDCLGLYMSYVSKEQAFVNSNEGRLFLLNTKEMKITDEISIENHEPLPVSRYYPNLVGENYLCTDLSYFEKIGDYLIFVYRRDKNTDLENWKDSLIIISTEKIESERLNSSSVVN